MTEFHYYLHKSKAGANQYHIVDGVLRLGFFHLTGRVWLNVEEFNKMSRQFKMIRDREIAKEYRP